MPHETWGSTACRRLQSESSPALPVPLIAMPAASGVQNQLPIVFNNHLSVRVVPVV